MNEMNGVAQTRVWSNGVSPTRLCRWTMPGMVVVPVPPTVYDRVVGLLYQGDIQL